MRPSNAKPEAESLNLRPARRDEIPAIEALIRAEQMPAEYIEEYLDGFVVAERGGELIACGGVERYGDSAVLRSIVVAQQARRLGLGRRLADALTERARSAGAREVYLFTSDAQAFWHHLGFEDVTLDEWPQAPRQGWQYRFIAANQDDPVFREVRGMRKPA